MNIISRPVAYKHVIAVLHLNACRSSVHDYISNLSIVRILSPYVVVSPGGEACFWWAQHLDSYIVDCHVVTILEMDSKGPWR